MTPLILIAEDNDIIIDMLRVALTHWGYASDVATSGEAVLALVRAHDFDLIIMDIVLTGMSGIEVARMIREMPEPKASVPIIALTGGMAHTTVAEMKAARFAAVLQKPVLPDDLRASIERHIKAPPHEL